jgi:zona occludens toxin
MITLTTGGPGTGKTAWLINQLIELKKQQPYREFFIHGIREFTAFKHTTIYCRSPLCDLCSALELPKDALFVEDWPDWYKSHFLIVIDEVQRIWSTSNGNNKTDAMTRLQTHRHYGLDFWLVSQSPKLIHTDVKTMVGRHIHLVSKWSGRKEYEWPEIQENIQSRGDAVVRPYSLPKHVFKFYKSAEVHTKQEKRRPISFYATIISLIIAVFAVGMVGLRLKARFSSQSNVQIEGKGGGGALASPSPLASNAVRSNGQMSEVKPLTQQDIVKSLTPLVVGLPWTAPIYQELAKPVSFPIIHGCIKSMKDNRCACYSQQATQIDMPQEVCFLYIKQAAFNHFKPDIQAYREQNQDSNFDQPNKVSRRL